MNLVTSSKGQRMMGYLPPYYASSKIMQAIMQAEGLEFDALNLALSDILNQFFVKTATWGLDIWEKMLDIPTVPGKPDDQRRSLIISKIRGIGTVNVALMLNVAMSYVNGTIEIIDSSNTYSFIVKFCDVRGVPPNLADLQAVIETIKPAHLAVNYQFTYTLVGDLINWGTRVGDLIVGNVTVGQLITWQP